MEPVYSKELATFELNYAIASGNLSKLPDWSKTASAIQKLFDTIKKTDPYYHSAIKNRLFEINIAIRHPAIKDKESVIVAIANNISEVTSDYDLMARVLNLNEVTSRFLILIITAEKAAGTIIESGWPFKADHSSAVVLKVQEWNLDSFLHKQSENH